MSETPSAEYQAAAAQAVGDVVQPGQLQDVGAGDAGPSLAQMQQDHAAALSDFEHRLAQMLDQAERDRAAHAAQIAELQRQVAAAGAAPGGVPPVQAYAASIAQRVRSLQAMHPTADMSAAKDAADKLAAAAAEGAGAGQLAVLAAPVARAFTSVHGNLEGARTLVAELGHLADAAAA